MTKELLNRLKQDAKPFLILDSAMGSELQRAGIPVDLPLWSAKALMENPNAVSTVHSRNIDAGAGIITTNTFRTNLRTFRKSGYTDDDARMATFAAVHLAKQAVKNSGCPSVLIAGSMAPVEDCYSPDLAPSYETAYTEHRTMAGWLTEAGVDLLLLETFGTVREATAAASAAHQSGLPFIISFILDKKQNLLSGEPFIDAVKQVAPAQPVCISLNCIRPESALKALQKHTTTHPPIRCIYPNLGKSEYSDTVISNQYSPEEFIRFAEQFHRRGVRIIGGCCGSDTGHIKGLYEYRQSLTSRQNTARDMQ